MRNLKVSIISAVAVVYDSFSVKVVHRVTKYAKIESLKNNFLNLVLGLYVNEKGKSKIFLQNSPFLAHGTRIWNF